MIGNNVQELALLKEQAKLDRMKRDNEIRRQRFLLTPKTRLIGIDVESLNQQSEEARLRREHELEMKRLEKLRLDEMERFLNQNAEEEKRLKMEQMSQLKAAWNEHQYLKDYEKQQYYLEKQQLIPTSLSGAQPLAGEDLEINNRLKQQKEQMKQWIIESMEDKKNKLENTRQYEERYNNMQALLLKIREQDELAEKEFRRKMEIDRIHENLEMARQRRELEMNHPDRYESYENKLKATSLDLFNEDKTIGMDDSTGRIKRIDYFKGYTDEKLRQIQMENEETAMERRRREEEERLREEEYARQQAALHQYATQTYEEEQNKLKQDRLEQMEYLRQQAREQALRNKQSNDDKFGYIDRGFYSNFGKTCR